MAFSRSTLKCSITVLALLLTCASGAFAQSRPAQSHTAENGVSLRLMLLHDVRELLQPGAETEAPSEIYYLAPDKSYQPISLQDITLTAPISYQGPQTLTFYTRSEDDSGQDVYQPAFSTQIGSGWQSAVILLIPSSLTQGGYQTLPIDTSPQSIKRGTIKVYNISLNDLAINADGKTSQIAPMQAATIDIGAIKRNLLMIALASRTTNGFEIVYKRNWSMRPDIRGIYLLYPQGETNIRWVMKNIIL